MKAARTAPWDPEASRSLATLSLVSCESRWSWRSSPPTARVHPTLPRVQSRSFRGHGTADRQVIRVVPCRRHGTGPDLPVIQCESWFGGFVGTRPHPLAPSVLHEVIRAQLTAQRVGGRRGHLTFPAHPIDVDILVVAGSAAVERDGAVHRVTAWQAVRLADAEGVVRGDPDACLVVGLSTDAPSLKMALHETPSTRARAPLHVVDVGRVSAVEDHDGMRVRSIFRGGRGSLSILSGTSTQERAERVGDTDEALLTLAGMKWLWVMPNRGDALDMPWLGAGRMLEPSLQGELVPGGHHHAITRFHGTGGELFWTAVQLLAPG